MSTLEKQIERFKSKPNDFTYDEVKRILNNLGFFENNKGKTSGSRVIFINYKDLSKRIVLHRPHPSNIIKQCQIKDILSKLREWRLL